MKSRPGIAVFAVFCVGFAAVSAAQSQPSAQDGKKLRVLIVDGYDKWHDCRVLTPLMKQMLEESGRFVVDVAEAVTPEEASQFRPRLADYDVVVNAYVGTDWPAETKKDFEAFVNGGGGYVCVHAADNAFANWPEYERIVGLSGWNGRDEKTGPYVFYNDEDELVREDSPGPAGKHGTQHEFRVRIRNGQHPITRGLPPVWLHAKDELYDSLRGQTDNLDVLATAYSDPKQQGTGRHEPVLMAIGYGKGRVFHTVMGHADYSMKCVGFVTTFLRGTEWAATGAVTIPVPDDFPTANQTRSRE
jgi:type 1 glutamine amidotransferase